MSDNIKVTINENQVGVTVQKTPSINVSLKSDGCSLVTEVSDSKGLEIFQPLLIGTGGGFQNINLILNEFPTGAINGSNTIFNLAHGVLDSKISIYLNGLKLSPLDFSILSSTQIQLHDAPFSGDVILVDYLIAITGGVGGESLFELDSDGDIEPK